MIITGQITDLAKFFQIDTFTVMREYLQLLLLSWLYREKKADKIYFKGGTSLRLLFGSPRFSEDLDFSSPYSEKVIRLLISDLEKSIRTELRGINIIPLYTGIKTQRFRLKYNSADFKYPFIIRLDFNRVKKIEKIVVSPLITKFPVSFFPLVNHLSEREILAEKICAMLTRAKGRDFFDVWFLLEKGILIDYNLIKQKMLATGANFTREDLIRKIKSHSEKQLELDLQQFLPENYRKIIGELKNRLLEKLQTPRVHNVHTSRI